MTRSSQRFIDWEQGVEVPKTRKRTVVPGNEPSLFAEIVPAARLSDPQTSNDGIHDVYPRAGSQQRKLLLAYASRPMGLTGEEAADIAGLNTPGTCWWKRVSELHKAGLLTDTFTTRTASTGSEQRVLALSERGGQSIAKS